MDTLVTGTIFGAALVASGMYSPRLITSQFSLERWNMAQTFLTATGCSALTIEILRQIGYAVPKPRPWTSAGLLRNFFPFDGNVLGGLLLGAGMSLSASCPGMVFPQLALGVPSAPAVVAGGGLGGIFWSVVLRPWIAARRKRAAAAKIATPTTATPSPPMTLAEVLNTSHTKALLMFEVLLAVIVATIAYKAPWVPSPLHPVAGGLAVAGAQLVSLLVRGSPLGVSTVYEQFGDWIVYLAQGGRGGEGIGLSHQTDHSGTATTSQKQQQEEMKKKPLPGTSTMLFGVAMMAGAWSFARVRPDMALLPAVATVGSDENLARFFAGGFLMAIGSRMAGGCTSGHGISGMSLMSASSLVTMVATFAAAMGVSKLCG